MQRIEQTEKPKRVTGLRKRLNKSVPLWLVLIILISGTAAALTLYTLTPEKISLFKGEITDSDFVVDNLVTKTKGLNKIVVKVTLRNTDTANHEANVTVALLDSNGDIIVINGVEMELTISTGNVTGGDTVKLTFTFTGANLVSVYESYLIEIYQLW